MGLIWLVTVALTLTAGTLLVQPSLARRLSAYSFGDPDSCRGREGSMRAEIVRFCPRTPDRHSAGRHHAGAVCWSKGSLLRVVRSSVRVTPHGKSTVAGVRDSRDV